MNRSSFVVRTTRRIETIDITGEIEELLPEGKDGICLIWSPHTTTAIAVNEGADPDVKTDIETTLARLFPHDGSYRHAEGNSDAHLKAVLVGPSETIPFEGGRLRLGRWQSVFLCEFDGPRSRTIEIYTISGA